MNKILLIVLICLVGSKLVLMAQQNTVTMVTATVVGPNTLPWANATGYAVLVCPGNAQAYINGFPVPRSNVAVDLNSSGYFSQQLYDASALVDVNNKALSCNYVFHFTDQCGKNSFITGNLTGIAGTATVNLSGRINTSAVNASFYCQQSGTNANAVLPNPTAPHIIQTPNPLTVTGPTTLNGPATIHNPCSINGLVYVSNGGCYQSLSAAFAACTASCTIDMRGNNNAAALALGSFDPGTKSVTILLGPYTYRVTQITLRTNLQIFGSGLANASGFSNTVLQQASASTAPIILPTSGTSATTVAQGVRLSNFALLPAAGTTSDGISLIAATCGVGCAGGGLWYSLFDNLYIGNFGRNELRIDNTLCDTCSNQFDTFQNIWAFRAKNNPPVVLITGSFSGQMTFESCQFDVAAPFSDSAANLMNVEVLRATGLGSNNFLPYSITFKNVTMQGANYTGGIALYVNDGQNITCDNCHFENDSTIASAANNTGSMVIMDSYVDASSGTGGLIKIDATSSLSFHDNTVGTNPPAGGWLARGSVPTFLNWYDNWCFFGGTSTNPLPSPGMTIAQLPPVAYAVDGHARIVTDSTAIATEGQVCTHATSGAVTAIAISNGTNWKCF
jgi:hypothetical protein